MQLYHQINYYHNRFFLINDKYYIYMYITDNNHIYEFKMINNNLHLFIKNKKRFLNNFKFKIMYEDNEYLMNIYIKTDQYNIGKIRNLNFTKVNNLLDININNTYLEDNFNNLFPNFDIDYYINNNNLIDSNNIKFIKYHWYLCGQFNPQIYFKYLLRKYEDIINNIKIPLISYSSENNNTLLFIDDRYDYSFIYLLKIFLYSVDETWNVTIFTIEECKDMYEKDMEKLNISGKINILEKKLSSKFDYSDLLKDENLWSKIKEDNILLFQYDSFCMGKFDNIFLNYNYIGARWPHNPLENLSIGNGGTSFRKTRIMESISKKYKNNYIEDLFFSYYLKKDELDNCTDEIADKFAFENIFCENSIYAHQLYNTIKLEDLDNYMFKKLSKMI